MLAIVESEMAQVDEARLIGRFIDLCRTDSAPYQEQDVARIVSSSLERLGLSVAEDDAARALGGKAGNIIATAPGRGRLAGHPPLLFSAHMDRVAGGIGVRPRIENGYVKSRGDTVLGADDAAGLAAIIEAAQMLVERDADHVPIEIVFTVCEEVGLLGAKRLDASRLKSRAGFVLDADGPVGSVVCRAPTQVSINAELFGVSAHAGIAPESGISAIRMAAAAISKMSLGRIDAETTANVGYIAGGGPTNIVPDKAELRAEVRSLSVSKLDRQLEHMRQALEMTADRFGGSVEWRAVRNYAGFSLASDSEPVRRAKAAAASLGVPCELRSTGGGSDANVFNERGIPCAVLGVGYEGIHTHAEQMPISELALLARLVYRLMVGDGSDGD